MALVKPVRSESFFTDLFHYQRCAEYFVDPTMLNSRLSDLFSEDFHLEQYYPEWNKDYQVMLNRFRDNKPMQEDLLDRYCNGQDYDMIRKKSGQLTLPSYKGFPVPPRQGVFSRERMAYTLGEKASPSIIFDKEWIHFIYSEIDGHYGFVVSSLVARCLFFIIHSLYRGKLVAGNCERCDKFYLLSQPARYCGKKCRDMSAVYRARDRKKSENSEAITV